MTDETQTPEPAEDEAPEAEAAEEAPAEEAPAEQEPEPAEPTPDEQVEALSAEVADLKDKLLRALAETENLRRRGERAREDAARYAIANFARDMVGVADNLGRAIASVDADARKADDSLETLCVGVEMTEKEMLAAFERVGIKPVEALGQKFDHNFHEAMFEMEDPSKPAGTVVQEIQKGFVIADRLLRPAKVGVSKGGPKETADAAPAEEKPAQGAHSAYESGAGAAGTQLDEEL